MKYVMDHPNFIIKTVTTILFLSWHVYWFITARAAGEVKKKTKLPTFATHVRRGVALIFPTIIFFQLLGLNLLPYEYNLTTQIIGLFFVIGGFTVSVLARKTLGANWTHAAEYQIKKDQALITNGLYKYIRHPIYSGLTLMNIGIELVLNSYLFIFFLTGYLLIIIYQCKKEEELLKKHFGAKYEKYMKTSKMLVPYLI